MNSGARKALSTSRFDGAVIACACVLGLVAGPAVIVALHGSIAVPDALDTRDKIAAVLALVLTIAIPTLFVVLVLSKIRVSRESARLAALPFPFDREAYFAILGEERSRMSLVMKAVFASPAGEPMLREALRAHAAHIEDVRWVDERALRFSSPTIDTSFEGTPGSATKMYSNHAIHAWFVRRALPLLLALHARSPITAILVSIAP